VHPSYDIFFRIRLPLFADGAFVHAAQLLDTFCICVPDLNQIRKFVSALLPFAEIKDVAAAVLIF